jgi:hypothetical protein
MVLGITTVKDTLISTAWNLCIPVLLNNMETLG